MVDIQRQNDALLMIFLDNFVNNTDVPWAEAELPIR